MMKLVKQVFAGLFIALALLVSASPAQATEQGKYWGCTIEP
jgi:hypothetical protein